MALIPFVPPYTETKTPFGELKVSPPFAQVFWDAFEGGSTIDTTNRWSTSTGGAGTATQSTGTLTVTSGLTVTGFGLVQTIPTFLPRNPAYMIEQAQVQLEAAPFLTNAYRFWGFGSFPGTPTLANPVNNGVGWEINTDGRLRAVTFASTARSVIADLGIGTSSAGVAGTGAQVQVIDGSTHMYVIYFRGDRIIWCIDNYDQVVASVVTGAQGPDINTIGWGALSLATTGITTTAAVNLAQITLSESAHNAFQLADGTYSFRRAVVTPQGQLTTAPLAPGTTVTASAVGTTGAIAATLAGAAGKTTYITGFSVTINNPTGAVDATITVAGTISGSLVYGVHGLAAGATVPQPPPFIMNYELPIPASGTNTAISVTLSALGTGGIGQVNVYGFQL